MSEALTTGTNGFCDVKTRSIPSAVTSMTSFNGFVADRIFCPEPYQYISTSFTILCTLINVLSLPPSSERKIKMDLILFYDQARQK